MREVLDGPGQAVISYVSADVDAEEVDSEVFRESKGRIITPNCLPK